MISFCELFPQAQLMKRPKMFVQRSQLDR
jgi:hypothetical protein